MCFTFTLLASAVFWIFVALDGSGLNGLSTAVYYALVLMHSVPAGLMIIEFPCNMIPFDFRMLPFNFILLILYMVNSMLFQLFEGKPVYKQLDWFNNTGVAIGVYLGFCAGEILIFSIVFAVSKYLKLPKYEQLSDEYKMQKITGKLTL